MALDVLEPELDAEEQATLARIVEHAKDARRGVEGAPVEAKPVRSEEALLALVWADPADDGARHVYADACTERGLPRGELVELSLRATRTRAQEQRLRALVEAHGHELLFELAPVVEPRSAVFERGFLAACKTRFRTPAQRALATHPAWSTVTTLTTDDAQVVRAAKALRVLHLRPRLLEALAKGPLLPVEALRVRLGRVVDRGIRARGAARDARVPAIDGPGRSARSPAGSRSARRRSRGCSSACSGRRCGGSRWRRTRRRARGGGCGVARGAAGDAGGRELRAYGFEVVLTREADGRWGVEVVPRGPGGTATCARGRRRSWGWMLRGWRGWWCGAR